MGNSCLSPAIREPAEGAAHAVKVRFALHLDSGGALSERRSAMAGDGGVCNKS